MTYALILILWFLGGVLACSKQEGSARWTADAFLFAVWPFFTVAVIVAGLAWKWRAR